MKPRIQFYCVLTMAVLMIGCGQNHQSSPPSGVAGENANASPKEAKSRAANFKLPRGRALHARDLLSDPNSLAFCYGGYRGKSREDAPFIAQIKEDLQILSAMGVKIVRTYNTQQFAFAENLLKAIKELREEDGDFDMYVMLGAWIECEGAWSKDVNHDAEHLANNTAEIKAAIRLAKEHPDTVKVIAVGNEAMVHWASSYFVRPGVILKWVKHLHSLQQSGDLPGEIWVTSSDNYAAWGGADSSYHTDDLRALIGAVDYVSLHTYPFHDTYHQPEFWIAPETEQEQTVVEQAGLAVKRAQRHAVAQYQSTAAYIKGLGIEKPIHIGETGWASVDSAHYGEKGSKAAGEYNAGRFYDAMRAWTKENRIACFYFEAFDEQWKDMGEADGSENHFGMIDLQGRAKFPLWDKVDAGVFRGLTRGGVSITKTSEGNQTSIEAAVFQIPTVSDLGGLAISTENLKRRVGEVVTESKYVLLHESLAPNDFNDMTYPSEISKLNVWESTCEMELLKPIIRVTTGTGEWWGCALEIRGDGKGEDLSKFGSGQLHLDIRGDAESKFQIGFQTGMYSAGTQVNCFVTVGPKADLELSEDWTTHSIPVAVLNREKKADLKDVTGLLFVKSETTSELTTMIEIRRIYWSTD